MGNFLIVSKVDKLEEYKTISEEYGVSFEINDFFIPTILDDEIKSIVIGKVEIGNMLPYRKSNILPIGGWRELKGSNPKW